MSELRLTGKTPEGTHLTLTDGAGSDFTLRITDTLRATVNQPRLTAVSVSSDFEAMSVKEMQRRLRHGETMESIARDGEISVDKVARFAGPILQERIFIIDQVQQISLRKEGARDSQTLLEALIAKLTPRGVDADSLTWSAWRLEDATWNIEVTYPNRDGFGSAQWNFDLHRRTASALDENSRWLLGQDPAPRRVETGLIYSETAHPSRTPEMRRPEIALDDFIKDDVDEPVVRETPRLVAIRETPKPEDSSDGITARAKVPSWDEIMFGRPAVVPTIDENPEGE